MFIKPAGSVTMHGGMSQNCPACRMVQLCQRQNARSYTRWSPTCLRAPSLNHVKKRLNSPQITTAAHNAHQPKHPF